MSWYVGVNNRSKVATNAYIGVNGESRQISKAYIGVNGSARLFYDVNGPVKVTVLGNEYSVPKGTTWLQFFTEYPTVGNCYRVDRDFGGSTTEHRSGFYPAGHEYYAIGRGFQHLTNGGYGYYEYRVNNSHFSSFNSTLNLLENPVFETLTINDGDVVTETWVYNTTDAGNNNFSKFGVITSNKITITFLGETMEVYSGSTVNGALRDHVYQLYAAGATNKDSYIFGTNPSFTFINDRYYIDYDAYLINGDPLDPESWISPSIIQRGYIYGYPRSLFRVLSDGDVITSTHIEGDTWTTGSTATRVAYPIDVKI